MAELPARGPHVEHTASNTDQPFNEAAFDPDDPEILRRVNPPRPEPAGFDTTGYPTDDDDLDDDLALYDDSDDDMYRAPVAPAWPDAERSRRTRWAA